MVSTRGMSWVEESGGEVASLVSRGLRESQREAEGGGYVCPQRAAGERRGFSCGQTEAEADV